MQSLKIIKLHKTNKWISITIAAIVSQHTLDQWSSVYIAWNSLAIPVMWLRTDGGLFDTLDGSPIILSCTKLHTSVVFLWHAKLKYSVQQYT